VEVVGADLVHEEPIEIVSASAGAMVAPGSPRTYSRAPYRGDTGKGHGC
jgi:hypothetical protein